MKALLVIDIQKGYIEKYPTELLDKINQRIVEVSENLSAVENSTGEENTALIVYVKNVRVLRSGKSVFELSDNLVKKSNYIFEKEKASIFSNQDFVDFLTTHQINEVEILGIDGNSCVASSAVDSAKIYKTTLNLNCIGVQNIPRFEDKQRELQTKGCLLIG